MLTSYALQHPLLPCSLQQVVLAILAVCACAVAAAFLYRHQWRKSKDAALRRHTQGRATMSRAGAGAGQQFVLNQVYQETNTPPGSESAPGSAPPQRQEDASYVSDTAIQSTRAGASQPVYAEAPLTQSPAGESGTGGAGGVSDPRQPWRLAG